MTKAGAGKFLSDRLNTKSKIFLPKWFYEIH